MNTTEWGVEIGRRAREVREGRTELVDGPSSLRAIRERLQAIGQAVNVDERR